MLQESEVIQLLLGIGTLIFIMINRRRLAEVPDYRLLRISFYAVFLAWTTTVLEGFVFPDLLNLQEHAFYAVGTLGVSAWMFRRIREGAPCTSSS
jgi:hypothetical protein